MFEFPIIPPSLMLPLYIGLIAVWFLDRITSSRRAERIQQDAQNLVNNQFRKLQNENDEFNRKQMASDLLVNKLVLEKGAVVQEVSGLKTLIETMKRHYEATIVAQEQSIALAETRIEGFVTERKKMAASIKQMEVDFNLAKTQLSSALARISELEKNAEEDRKAMENFAYLLTEEKQKRKDAESAYLKLQAEMADKIRLAVDEATKPLHTAIMAKDVIIDQLQAELVEAKGSTAPDVDTV